VENREKLISWILSNLTFPELVDLLTTTSHSDIQRRLLDNVSVDEILANESAFIQALQYSGVLTSPNIGTILKALVAANCAEKAFEAIRDLQLIDADTLWEIWKYICTSSAKNTSRKILSKFLNSQNLAFDIWFTASFEDPNSVGILRDEFDDLFGISREKFISKLAVGNIIRFPSNLISFSDCPEFPIVAFKYVISLPQGETRATFIKHLPPVASRHILSECMHANDKNFWNVMEIILTLLPTSDHANSDNLIDAKRVSGYEKACLMLVLKNAGFHIDKLHVDTDSIVGMALRDDVSLSAAISVAKEAVGRLEELSCWAERRVVESAIATVLIHFKNKDVIGLASSLSAVDDEKVCELLISISDIDGLVESRVSKFLSETPPWRNIDSTVGAWLSVNASIAWTVAQLGKHDPRTIDILFERLGEEPLMSLLGIRDLVSLILALSHSDEFEIFNVGFRVMDILVHKQIASGRGQEDFSSLFELAEQAGDETGEWRKIYFTYFGDLMEDSLDKDRSAIIAKVTNWIQILSPGEFHDWVTSSKALKHIPELLVKFGISAELMTLSVTQNRYNHADLKQSFSSSSKLLVCRYTTCGGEINTELRVLFPDNWPARLATIEVSPVAGLTRTKNSKLHINTQKIFRSNGVQQSIQIWIENIEGYLKDVEECYICYSVTYHHGTKGTGSGDGTGGSIPDKECNCVLCQQPF
jgi:hypothetical protein